jgi:hypothetical protein
VQRRAASKRAPTEILVGMIGVFWKIRQGRYPGSYSLGQMSAIPNEDPAVDQGRSDWPGGREETTSHAMGEPSLFPPKEALMVLWLARQPGPRPDGRQLAGAE